MADDLYNFLIGNGPDKQSQSAIADQLRRRRSFGELGSLTGDRVLQPFGQGMSQQADKYATQLQDIRQKDADNAQTKEFQTGQLSHLKGALAETTRKDTMDHVFQMLMAQAALEKADKTGTTKPSKLTYADRTKLENMSQLVNGADDTMGQFKDEYSQRLGPGPQSKLPNAMAAVGIGTQGSKDAANWWGQWNLLYTLPQRNATFGATLTPHEKQAWAEADIGPSMSGEQIRDRVSRVLKILKSKGGLMNRTYRAQYDPEVIDSYGLPGEENIMGPAGAPAGHGSPAAIPGQGAPVVPRRVKVDASGNVIG